MIEIEHTAHSTDPPWPLLGRLWRDAMTGVVYRVSEALAEEAAARSG